MKDFFGAFGDVYLGVGRVGRAEINWLVMGRWGGGMGVKKGWVKKKGGGGVKEGEHGGKNSFNLFPFRTFFSPLPSPPSQKKKEKITTGPGLPFSGACLEEKWGEWV